MLSTEGSVVRPGPQGAGGGTAEALLPGAKAGPWIVGERLGRGGMGTVYAVTHEEIGKRAARKVMHDFLATGITAERIKLEARVVNRVGHPNIVDIFETGTLEDGRPYIVMEANPKKFPHANAAGARALSDFLLSPKVQNYLLEFGRDTSASRPLFFPINATKL